MKNGSVNGEKKFVGFSLLEFSTRGYDGTVRGLGQLRTDRVRPPGHVPEGLLACRPFSKSVVRSYEN